MLTSSKDEDVFASSSDYENVSSEKSSTPSEHDDVISGTFSVSGERTEVWLYHEIFAQI